MLASALLVLLAPATQAVAAPDPVQEIGAVVASTLARYDEVVSGFSAYASTASDPDAVDAAFVAAMDAIQATRDTGRDQVGQIEALHRRDAAVRDAARQGRRTIDDGADAATADLQSTLGNWVPAPPPPPTTTPPATTTTAPATTVTTPVTTTTAPVTTTTTTTTAPKKNPTTVKATTTTTVPQSTTTTTNRPAPPLAIDPPPDPPGTSGSAENGTRPSSYFSTSRWDPVGPIQDDFSVAPSPLRLEMPASTGGGTVVAWLLDPRRNTAATMMSGPLVLLESMARALVRAGRGLAAPASLLLSLTVVLVMDRQRLVAAVRGQSAARTGSAPIS